MKTQKKSHVELFVMGDSMRSIAGSVEERDGDKITLRVADVSLSGGEVVCLQANDEGDWLYGKVTEVAGNVLTVRVDGSHSPDRREFARVWGPVQARYKVIGDKDDLIGLRWIKHGESPEGIWLQPSLFMDFSGSGARFEVGAEAEGDSDQMVLLGMRVPTDDAEHRFVGHIVRRLKDNTQLAIRFDAATDGGTAALVGFAEAIQEQLVESLIDADDR